MNGLVICERDKKWVCSITLNESLCSCWRKRKGTKNILLLNFQPLLSLSLSIFFRDKNSYQTLILAVSSVKFFTTVCGFYGKEGMALPLPSRFSSLCPWLCFYVFFLCFFVVFCFRFYFDNVVSPLTTSPVIAIVVTYQGLG